MRTIARLCFIAGLILFFAGASQGQQFASNINGRTDASGSLSAGVTGTLPAQEFGGNINGRITDASGGLLAGVSVILKSSSIQGERHLTTDESGNYRFILLPPGTFSVTYELPGFRTLVREGVIVQVGMTTTLNISLEVGTGAETIFGQESPVVDVQNARVAVNFSQSMLRDIPNARDIWVVLARTPGVMVTTVDVGGSTMGTQTNYRSFGQHGQNWANLDGI